MSSVNEIWFSPLNQPVALRYERDDPASAWRITGLIVSSRAKGLGSAWMKSFQWRGLATPWHSTGILWDGTPSIELLDEMFDDDGRMIKIQYPRQAYRDQSNPSTDSWEVFRNQHAGSDMDRRIEWGEMLTRLIAEGASKQTIEDARKDFFYQRVAEVYQAAMSGAGKPVEAVAEAFEAPRTTAANWIKEARARGHLPPTTKGRAT